MVQSKSTRRTATQWTEIINRHKASGKTIKTYCQEEGLCSQSFYSWRKRLSTVKKVAPKKFVQLSRPNDFFGYAIKISTPQGLQIEVSPHANAGCIKDIIHSLREEYS